MRWKLGLLASLASACAGKADDSAGVAQGPHALTYGDRLSCAESTLSPGDLGETFTFELWLKSDPGLSSDGHPFMVWQGRVALWQTSDGFVTMSDASGDVAGAAYPADLMDQQLHHVAGTWDGESLTVFVDGVRGGFSRSFSPGDGPGRALYIGCWPSQERYHEGIIDEVRISTGVRYTDTFAPSLSAFETDDETVRLWHVDEGFGGTSADAAGGGDLLLTEVGWLPFALEEQ